MTVLCPNGHENEDGKAFCGDCGSPLENASPPEAVTHSETQSLASDAAPAPTASKKSPAVSWGVVVVVVGVVGLVIAAIAISRGGDDAGGAATPTLAVDQTRFENAYAGCGVTSESITVADAGDSLILDGPPDGSARMDVFLQDLACVIDALGVPDFVVHNMENTTSLMGLQEASWDGIHAQWSYHPDNGLDLVLTEEA
jgi:hypothetical protein